jgi:predicted DNA-binding transcriptional regulator AlpA
MSTADIPVTDPDQLPLWEDGPTPLAQPAKNGDQLWSIKDVGHFLDVPVATIYQWRVRGEGPPATRMGKHLRFEPEVVRAWVSEHREGA